MHMPRILRYYTGTDEMTLEKEAMRLSARERALLADALLESLSDEATQKIQELWAAEADDRLQAFREGRISARDASDVLKDAISKFSP